MKRLISTAALLALMSSGAAASTYILDFDGDDPTLDSSATQPISSPRTIIDDGVEWSVTTSGGDGAALFNTLCTGYGGSDGCNNDGDLQPGGEDAAMVQGQNGVAGNILIQQRSGGSLTPNDDAQTSWITLTLKSDVKLRWTGASVVDDGRYVFTSSVDGLTELGSIWLANDNDTGQASFTSGILGLNDSITIDFKSARLNNSTPETDSGGVDRLVFSVSQVPVPASLPLLLAGFGAFAALRSRKKKS